MSKPRPPAKVGRKRRAAGWVLLTLGVLVAGVWVASGWQRMEFPHLAPTGWYVCIRSGALSVFVPTGPSARNDVRMLAIMLDLIDYGSSQGRWNWWPIAIWDRSSQSCFHVETVFWPIPLVLWAPAALLLRSGIVARRRAIAGVCRACGYSLAGLAEGAACPECGKGAGTK